MPICGTGKSSLFRLLHSSNFIYICCSPCVENTLLHATFCLFVFQHLTLLPRLWMEFTHAVLPSSIQVFYMNHFVVQVYGTGVSFHLQHKGFICILTAMIILLACLEPWHVICATVLDHQILCSTECLLLAVYLLQWLRSLCFAGFRWIYRKYDLWVTQVMLHELFKHCLN